MTMMEYLWFKVWALLLWQGVQAWPAFRLAPVLPRRTPGSASTSPVLGFVPLLLRRTQNF